MSTSLGMADFVRRGRFRADLYEEYQKQLEQEIAKKDDPVEKARRLTKACQRSLLVLILPAREITPQSRLSSHNFGLRRKYSKLCRSI